MPKARTITLKTGRTRTELEVSDILYVLMDRNYANIHMEFGGVYKSRVTFDEIVHEDRFGSLLYPYRTTLLLPESVYSHSENGCHLA